MMKRIVPFVFVGALVALGSCGGKGSQPMGGDELDSTAVVILDDDSLLYGICGDGTAMNTLQLITDSGDTLTLSIAEANDKGQCFGGFQSGDRMAVMLQDQETAKMVINQSALLGDWVMPNPLDGSDEVGISIKEGGVAESIDQGTIIYRTWRLSRGRLEIVLVRDGANDVEELNVYDIVKLTADSLVYKDEEETFEYGRQKPKETYGDEVKLEDTSYDFKM